MDIDAVTRIVGILSEYPVTEIAVERDGQRICVKRPPVPKPAFAVETPSASVSETPASPIAAEEETHMLTAGMVGLFHHTEPPVAYAQIVAAGQTIGGIEAMKLITDVVAERGGRVIEVLVEDGSPVEYGQPLFRFAPITGDLD